MTKTHYERLGGQDLSFLVMEDGRVHMHIGMVAIFEAGPLRLDHGGLDIDRIEAYMASRLHLVPRLRQKLAWVPGIGQPVWVDDPDFNVHFHVRHTALPPPGDIRQLKRMAARVMSQELDRGKPLWEYWFVDGLEDDRFAIVSKVHHCMIDGVAGVEMVQLLMSLEPDAEPDPEPPPAWEPRPAPSGTTLFVNEFSRRITEPIGKLGSQLLKPGGISEALSSFDGFREAADSLGPSDTPLNLRVGPHRRFDWTRFSFDAVHDVGTAAGGKVNDVVLAVTAGALARFFEQRGFDLGEQDILVHVPIDVRTAADGGSMGNKVSGMAVPLPMREPDPWERLQQVIATTTELKAADIPQPADTVNQIVEVLPPKFMGPFFRIGSQSTPANFAITNVRGPRVPLYMLGARQIDIFGAVPLIGNQALGIALMSYDDGLFWGFNADWDVLDDLHDLVEAVESEFAALEKAAKKRAKKQNKKKS